MTESKDISGAQVIGANHYSARWSWRVTAPAILLLSILIAVFSPSSTLEGWWIDQKFKLLPRAVATDEIVVVGITEKTFAVVGQPFGLWHEALGMVFARMAEAKPRLVVLDLELPTREFKANPGGMQSLAAGVSAMRASSTALVAGRGIDPDGNLNPVDPVLEAVVGPENFGVMLWRPDGDGVVRRTSNLGVGFPPTLLDASRAALEITPAPQAQGLINYRLGTPFEMIDVADFLTEDRDRRQMAQARIKGKVVVMGMATVFDDRVPQPSNLLLNDTRPLPLGMLLYAQGLRSAVDGRIISHQRWWGIALAAVVMLASFGFVASVREFTYFSFGSLMVLLLFTASMTMFDLQVDFLPSALFLQIALPLVTTRHLVYMMKERNRLRGAFQGYVSPSMLDAISKSSLADIGSTKRVHVATMFVDIRGFTTLSAQQPPESTVARLNRYFDVLSAAVHAESGTIDKFRGDGMMAYFGAPLPLPAPESAALRAALRMMDGVRALSADLVREGLEPIEIGIGVASGEVVIGKVGSRERFDFTIIGDAANLAAHLQEHTKAANASLLVEASTFARASLPGEGASKFVHLGDVPLHKHGVVPLVGVLK